MVRLLLAYSSSLEESLVLLVQSLVLLVQSWVVLVQSLVLLVQSLVLLVQLTSLERKRLYQQFGRIESSDQKRGFQGRSGGMVCCQRRGSNLLHKHLVKLGNIHWLMDKKNCHPFPSIVGGELQRLI